MNPLLTLGPGPVQVSGLVNSDSGIGRIVLIAPLVAVSFLTLSARLHNQGVSGCGLLAWVASFAVPLAFGTASGSWVAWPGRGWRFPVVASLSLVLLPTAIVAAVVHFKLGAMLYHPSALDSVHWLTLKATAFMGLAAAEEFFFRGWLQQSVFRRTRRPVAWSAAFFALAHVASTGLVWFAPLWFVSGLVLGWVTRRAGGSLWPALLIHVAGNLALAWTGTLIAMNLPYAAPS